MKLLKFKIWDVKEKEWVSRIDLRLAIEDCLSVDDNAVCILEQKGYKIVQFTGLWDKNYKKIYEGDFVELIRRDILDSGSCGQCRFRVAGVVEWDDKSAGFHVRCKEHNTFSLYTFTKWWDNFSDPDTNEIIGNVFENPELLKFTWLELLEWLDAQINTPITPLFKYTKSL